MSLKRRNTSSPECEGSSKRQRSKPVIDLPTNDSPFVKKDEDVNLDERPQVNSSTGQSGAFPGLGNDEDEEIFYGPANDGLDYLRMVRSEARGIPQLLVAQPAVKHDPTQKFDEHDEEDEGGYWDDDGTYTARANVLTIPAPSKLPLAQICFYDTLLTYFEVIRATMKCIPPLSAIERLASSQPISFPPESKKARSLWKECLLTREPSPVQIACMDTDSVFQLVKLINMQLRVVLGTSDLDVVRRFGSWIWAVLGKCPSQGELMSEDVSELRELARKAIQIANRLDEQEGRARPRLEEDYTEDEEAQSDIVDQSEDLSADIAAAKRRLGQKAAVAVEQNLQSLDSIELSQPQSSPVAKAITSQNSPTVTMEKMAVLDMILMVIGEIYGQRDLLELRKPWKFQDNDPSSTGR